MLGMCSMQYVENTADNVAPSDAFELNADTATTATGAVSTNNIGSYMFILWTKK